MTDKEEKIGNLQEMSTKYSRYAELIKDFEENEVKSIEDYEIFSDLFNFDGRFAERRRNIQIIVRSCNVLVKKALRGENVDDKIAELIKARRAFDRADEELNVLIASFTETKENTSNE